MSIADYLKQLPDRPMYFCSPAGIMRVVGVVQRGNLFPLVQCVSAEGAVIEWACLFSTELMEEQ